MLRGKRLLAATGNAGKAKEIAQILDGMAIEIFCLGDLAALWREETLGGLPPLGESGEEAAAEIRRRYARLETAMAETGNTFAENALLKARGAARFTGWPALADDSGLEVDYLLGAPGIFTARYAGARDAAACNQLLLRNLAGVPAEKRTAKFRTVMALVLPDGREYTTSGVCEGRIGLAPVGDGGFGYDPIFVLPEKGCTAAELTPEEKNAISHRGKALREMKNILWKVFAS
ncbi:MAG: RdgB/HAM1 family non-canonical purine NTP pyrophosphatase [Peptococcaceae bacterium]|jgi:XTP/dITP diphosphohydrolase|nr:RdgB/HAM1 family non-canonical purine NTP pyrophosphatase [Peptococcaceae bacterium]